MLEYDIKIGWADLYDYNLKHSFSQPINILAEILGLLGTGYGIYTKQPMAIVIGLLLVVYLPVTLFTRSKTAAALTPSFKKTLHYALDDEGLTISQGEECGMCKWEEMTKAVSTARSIILYTSPVNATIFPRAQLGDSVPCLIRVISEHLPPEKVKIKS